ncbi:glucoamylase family protein [Halomicrococcus sp. NG-SE-24]|uniref:glucoamylase family protein n=1 Tax=Halomicrococcus sp. NG-SE-24 TaxID=3436928 RepID=UPI003D99FA2E
MPNHGSKEGKRTVPRRSVLGTIATLSTGTTVGTASAARSTDQKGRETERSLTGQLRGIARKTYRFVQEFTRHRTGFVPDRVDETPSGYEGSGRTSPANIGVQLLTTVSANELGFLDDERARDRLTNVLSTLERAETWNGLFYRWYDVETGEVRENSSSARNVSTIDNGWLSAGLLVVGHAFPALRERAYKLVESADYTALYDPEIYDLFEGETTKPGHMHAKHDSDSGLVGHYGSFNTEPRIAYYLAIGKDDIDLGSWWQMYRTFPPGDAYSWTNQNPSGVTRTYQSESFGEMPVYEGHYEYLDEKYVPSWGGSMFESLMPSLVLKEKELGTDALGLNNHRQAYLQVEYANEQGYDAWGFSPCATPDGYGVYGVDKLGISGYEEEGIVTPHATFLALEYADEGDVLENIRTLKNYGAESQYGFYDSVDVTSGTVTKSYLILDQAMVLAPIANYLADGVLRDHFHGTSIGSGPEELLSAETFSI